MADWKDCYVADGPHAGRVYRYAAQNTHLLIGGWQHDFYLITDELFETPSGKLPVARYYGHTPPPGAEPVEGTMPPDYY